MMEVMFTCLKTSGVSRNPKMALPQVLTASVKQLTAMMFMTEPTAACRSIVQTWTCIYKFVESIEDTKKNHVTNSKDGEGHQSERTTSRRTSQLTIITTVDNHVDWYNE